MKILRLIFILFFSLSFLFPQQTLEPIRILGVDVEGNEMASDRVIKYTSGLLEGKEIIPGDFGQSVKKLWRTELFSDIQIFLEKETVDGIFIKIVVEENPILGEIKFEGNKKKKQSDFDEELDLTSGQRIQPYLINNCVEKIKEIYSEDGYLRVEVDTELLETERENVKDLTFHIKENKKVKIKEIRFIGNKVFSNFKLRRKLKETKVQRWYLFWRSTFDNDKYEEDKIALGKFYRNHGYKDFRIISDSFDYVDEGKRMVITIEVSEGHQYQFRNFTWEGNTLYSDDALMDRLNLERGDIYNEEDFNISLYEWVQGLYMDKGYIYSQITPQFIPVRKNTMLNPDAVDSLDVHFVVVENHQVSVRDINISGNTKTRENVIRREFKILPGDIFNRELLMRSVREVMILNYFSNVVPDVLPVEKDKVDLLIEVEEKSSDRANASIGFTGEYGITGGASLEFNNFLGRGQQLVFSFEEGTQYSVYTSGKAAKHRRISISFTDPMINDTPNLIGFSMFYYLRGKSPYYYSIPLDREVYGGAIRFGRRFKWPDNFFRGTWMIQGTKKLYTGSEEDLEQYVGGYEKTLGISVTQFIKRDSRNHPEFPSKGSVMNWTSSLSGGILGGNENFHKHVLKCDWYTPTFWKFVLYSSLQMGAIKEIKTGREEISIIPVDEKFFMGGSGIPYGNMLRGYVDNTVGPYDGGPLGGTVLLKCSAEFRFPFSENPTVYGLAFAEMGNVWNGFDGVDPFDLKRSAGIGIRMFMPMLGMLGFDYGYGFDDIPATEQSPEGWNFHILFGMPF